jgi:drug/metabolite transporter (DMT)-like permease
MTMPANVRLSAAIMITVLLWRSAFVGIRSALPALGFANLAAGRLALAALTFLLLSRRFRVVRPNRSQLVLLAGLGATGYAGYQLLLSAGEQTVPAGTSALIFSFAPLLAMVLARPLLGALFALPSGTGLPHAVATAPPSALLTLLGLGVITTTVPFLLWTWAMSQLDATKAAPLLLLIAPATLLVGFVWLGELPTGMAVLGGAITLLGVASSTSLGSSLLSRSAARRSTRTRTLAPLPARGATLPS